MKRIDLKTLQNAEHLALMTDVLNLITEANLQPLDMLKTQFQTAVKNAEDAQLQIRKNQHTESLTALDEKRDRLYRGLVLRVQSEELSPNEERRAAAAKVLLVVDTYGNFTSHNYQKETTEITNFLADLQSADYKPSAEKIGLTEWMAWLKTANNDFQTLYTNRRDEYAAQPTYDLKAIRRELDDLFRKFQQTAEALAILQPSAELSTLIAKTDASVSQWKNILAQRKGKKSSPNIPLPPEEENNSNTNS